MRNFKNYRTFSTPTEETDDRYHRPTVWKSIREKIPELEITISENEEAFPVFKQPYTHENSQYFPYKRETDNQWGF